MTTHNTNAGFDPRTEPTARWINQFQNSLGNLEHPGPHHVGREIRFIYPAGYNGDEPVTGVIAACQGAEVVVQDDHGDIHGMNLGLLGINTPTSVYTRRMGETPPAFRNVGNAELFEELEQGKAIFGSTVVRIGGKQWKEGLLAGRLGIKKISDEYSVIQIESENGAVHLIDPDRASRDILVTENPEDISVFKSFGEPIIIIDKDREERHALAAELVEQVDILGNEKYYDYFIKDLPRAKKLLLRWYSSGSKPDGGSINEVLERVEQELGSEYIAVLGDPGIIQHFQEFMEYSIARQADGGLTTPLKLRQAFAEHLGSQTVYRGMMLTDAELIFIQRSGMLAPTMLDKKKAAHIVQDSLDPRRRIGFIDHARSFYEEIMNRLSDNASGEDNLLTLSVTSYEPVAESVGYHDSGHIDAPGKSMYVFECEIPKISLIKMEGFFATSYRPNGVLSIGNLALNEHADPEVEMFVPYFIPANLVRNIQKLDERPVRWVRFPNTVTS